MNGSFEGFIKVMLPCAPICPWRSKMMKICLKTYAKQSTQQCVVVHMQNRLPDHIHAPCELTCKFHVEACSNYFLMVYDVQGLLAITCQRCLGEFNHPYSNQTQLAVCADDATAERLMEHFECVVSPDYPLDLNEVLADELHLFSPEKHLDFGDCDPEINRIITDKT